MNASQPLMPILVSPLNEQAQVQEWDFAFEELMDRIRPYFSRIEAEERARSYVQGLLSPIERKNGWQLAEEAGDSTPYGIQNLLGRSVWEADGVRDELIEYVQEHLFSTDGVGVLDETGFIKKGKQSVGVQRQYSGTVGKVENCQIGVFLSYVSDQGHTFLDRALYLPESWTQDPDRCRRAGVPDDIEFATKPALAQQMVARTTDLGMCFAWITGDAVYGNNPGLRQALEAQVQAYVLGIACNESVVIGTTSLPASEAMAYLRVTDWHRLSAGNGTKGPRTYDWAVLTLSAPSPDGWAHRLLFRRSLKDPNEIAYYRVFSPTECTLSDMVRVAGCRWTIEECFETAKGEVGLDQYEVRSWTGWYRHITLACLAHAFLSVMRTQSLAIATEKGALKSHKSAANSSLAVFMHQRGL
ncbi:transposase family protein [Leptolyngbya sp. PCC 7375]|nr:transposase family protein [Leptolyngbya sp. PCC 7375]EKU96917.1 transposase family protein [Leptolyngbya sp. PCC 7375]